MQEHNDAFLFVTCTNVYIDICTKSFMKSDGALVLPYGEYDNFLIIPSFNLI